MTKKSIIISAILILVVIIGGFWYVNNNQKSKIKNQKQVEQQVTNEKVETAREDDQEQDDENIKELKVENDTSGWKEYCNEEYGFCLKYPRDWFCGGIALDPKSIDNIFCAPEKFEVIYYEGKYNGGGIMIYVDHAKRIYDNIDQYGIISKTLIGKSYNIQFTVFPSQDKKIENIIFPLLLDSFSFTK